MFQARLHFLETEKAAEPKLSSRQGFIPSCRKVRSFLTTGNRGMMGGCMLWLLRMLRYLAMFLDGSNTSWRSPNSFSYLLGNFSHELRSRATGAKFRPLRDTRVDIRRQKRERRKKAVHSKVSQVSGSNSRRHREKCCYPNSEDAPLLHHVVSFRRWPTIRTASGCV